jgi:hypothetical protein
MSITREIRDPDRLDDAGRFDLGRLTSAERLFLWRHRQKVTNGRLLGRNGSSMSQAEAAAHLGIRPKLYNKLENGGKIELSTTLDCSKLASSEELVVQLSAAKNDVSSLLTALGPLEPSTGELCFLARRRSGQLLMTLERELGVSRPRYHEFERAGDPVMVRFWEERGFRFPA